jgi:hypothetical protein
MLFLGQSVELSPGDMILMGLGTLGSGVLVPGD